MRMVIMERRQAAERPQYSFEVKRDEDRGTLMMGVWKAEKLIFALDLPGKMDPGEMASLGDGLAMIHAKAYEEGAREMFSRISDHLVQIGRELYAP